MNILQIHNRYIYPGGEDASVDRIFGAISQDHRVERCLFTSADWQKPGAPPSWRQALLMWSNTAALQKIEEAHRKIDADCWLVHNFIPVASAGIYRLAARLRVPLVQYCHNFRPFSVSGYLWACNRVNPAGLKLNFGPEIACGEWQNSRFKTAWLAAILLHLHWSGIYRRTSAWVAISEFMRDRFVEGGLPSKKVHALRHSWDLINPSCPSTPTTNQYLFLGRLTEAKGVKTLIQSWNILHQRMGDNCPFLTVGGEGPMSQELAAASQANKRIVLKGYVDGRAKRELLAASNAVLVPSIWWEGMGLVAYEAYDFAKPVFAAASGGLGEIVFDGKTGRLHHPGSAEQLASQVEEAESNPGQLLQWGREGRNWLEANTRPDQWRKSFSAILEQAISRNSLADEV
jgi:glycosyltransferase involved in cell wall biosynthesis